MKFTPGMKVTYTNEARQAWIDAKVMTPLPEGDGTVVATPKPYLSVKGLAYVVWDSLPGKWTLTDENALMQITPEVESARPYSLAKLYILIKYNWGDNGAFSDDDLSARMGHDFARLAAHGIDPNTEHTSEEWDQIGAKLHLYLGMEVTL